MLQQLQSRGLAESPVKIIKSALKDAPLVKVDEVLPRQKEGGAFVKFTRTGDASLQDIESSLKSYLKENPIRPPFWPFQRVRANLVQGKPWVEDLYRMPSPRLKVEFLPAKPGVEATELSQEQLYSIFPTIR